AQRLPRRILGLEHDFPGLADHAQTNNWFLRRELCAAAVDGLNSFFVQLGQTIENIVEIGKHEAEENTPHEISKTGKRNQRHGQVEEIAGLSFCLASLLEHAAMQQFVE